jgi:diguanylate cyclase (GGDEF)-like protein
MVTALVVLLVLFIPFLVAFGLYRRRLDAAQIAHRLSVTDSLTGLRNRRYVTETIDADAALSARRYGLQPPGRGTSDADLVFLLIDIDHFKAVNDRYGHAAGDRVLAELADTLRGVIRSSDTLARWDGEAFLAICRFTSRESAAMTAERIRHALATKVFTVGGESISHTCSIGFASYPFSRSHPEALAWDQVLTLAEQALHLAKQADRNAWVGVFEGMTAGDLSEVASGPLRTLVEQDRVRLESSRPLFDVGADGLELVPSLAGGVARRADA